MTSRRTTIHRRRIRRRRAGALLLALVLASAVALGDQLSAGSSTWEPPLVREHRDPPRARPGLAGLDPALRRAFRRAAAGAADDGVRLLVRSGRRTPEDQRRLFAEAVAKHGSAAEAARWVAPPDRSAHVSGDAVDVGPAAAAAWLAEHGAAHGLCRIYANEPWHFELRPRAAEQGCPPVYPDPTHDPRLQP